MPDAQAAAHSVFGAEAGRIIATLIRLSGSFDLAEDALQEAFASALTQHITLRYDNFFAFFTNQNINFSLQIYPCMA